MLLMPNVVKRGPKNDHHSVAQKLIDGSVISENNLDHATEKFIKKLHQFLRYHLL